MQETTLKNNYEAHITIEPVFGFELERLKYICNTWGFRVAELLIQKSRTATPVRSDKDTFCTSHSTDFKLLNYNTKQCIWDLKDAGFKIWRHKIELILLDEKYDRETDDVTKNEYENTHA